MPYYFYSYEYEISWSVLRFFATIVFIGCFSDSIRIVCALNEAMIKVHPIAEWWVSQLSISQQSIKIGLSFVHPRSLCLYLTWQLSAKSSHHGIPPFIVYTSFECVQLWYLLLPPPKHYLTTLVIDFSLSFGFTGPGYSMPSSARSSAKQAHVGVKKTSTPIFLTCSTHWLLHWWSRGSYIAWEHQVAQACV
jgi:hypothetical protein